MPNPTPDLSTLSDNELIEQLLAAEADENAAKIAKKKLSNELINRTQAVISALYKAKPEPYGIVNLDFGGKAIKVETVKVVEWDQSQLEKLWGQILSDGADPKQYIKAEYGVSETAYKSWGDNIRAFFDPARTVKARNPSIKIIEKE